MAEKLYGYVLDEAFTLFEAIDLDNSHDDQVIGYLTDRQFNYFKDPLQIRDQRSPRASILGQAARGSLKVLIDKNRITTTNAFVGVTSDEVTQLFNIIEYMVLIQGANAGVINDHFMGDASNFGVYTTDTTDLSINGITVPVYFIDNTTQDVLVRDWIEFGVTLNEQDYIFHLWLNNSVFVEDYPYSTIREIIAPCDPADLLSPATTGSIAKMIEVQKYDNELLATALSKDDYTGMLVYNTKYIDKTTSEPYEIPFSIIYQGVIPSSLDIRKAVRDYILATGLASEDGWKVILPNLFVTDQFFMVPTWDNITEVSDRVLYPGIIKPQFITKAREIWPDIDTDFIDANLEIMTNAIDDKFIFYIPDPLNANPENLSELHKTYQPVVPTAPAFDWQDSVTKEFNKKLCSCLNVLNGSLNTQSFMENSFYGRLYLSFVVNAVEYHVLTKDDYDIEE